MQPNKSDIPLEGRAHPLRMPPAWEPPYPAFMSRFGPEVAEVAMAVVGCQYDADSRDAAWRAISALAGALRSGSGAAQVDLAHCEDGTGHHQYAATAYWLDPQRAATWFESSQFDELWSEHTAENRPYGVYREVFNIPLERFETLHSGPEHVVGVAYARTGMDGPMQLHAYWGSMRDRIPAAADDAFAPAGSVQVLEHDARRVLVRANDNLAIIRSGQDWSHTTGTERDEYQNDIEPVLRAGMTFLRDEGDEVQCIDCRYMHFLNADGTGQDHSFGLAYFRSLKDLEDWAEHHPTHLAIFNAFLEVAPRYGPDMQSRYWHEVSVLPAAGQWAEYVNCAPGTGLMPAD